MLSLHARHRFQDEKVERHRRAEEGEQSTEPTADPPIVGKEEAQCPAVRPHQHWIDGRDYARVGDCDGGVVWRWLQGGAREAGAAIALLLLFVVCVVEIERWRWRWLDAFI